MRAEYDQIPFRGRPCVFVSLNAYNRCVDHEIENGRHHCLPHFWSLLQLDVYAAHAYGRESDNLTLKEGQSGRFSFYQQPDWRYGIPDASHVGSFSIPCRQDSMEVALDTQRFTTSSVDFTRWADIQFPESTSHANNSVWC